MESVGMLSRILARSAAPRGVIVRSFRTSAPAVSAVTEGPERDVKNFPRPVRPIYPGKVRMGFIPEEWFELFYKKTGVTGPYMFGVSFLTYLCSKEIYIMEHEYYNGLSLALLCIIGVKKLGPSISAWLDKGIDQYENSWEEGRKNQLQTLQDSIEAEKKEQWRAEGQTLLFEAKKENIALQIEAAYRERLMQTYSEVKKRLDYQVETQNIETRISQKHMTQWIVNNVLKSITPQQEKDSLKKCISDLKALSAVA
ncbi:ATP synthase subunit b, mitochondrial [Neocloeon triangulifer]|uniref:ATP synthase subunit b, mitochondrial n=1 Tax=Neocloeon triangulifer TaxID=2078957 RepID=UPI00286EC87D|nr:ATP synthase subunit b, mitochondrial [Neocloeon triangulifer]